MSQRCLPIYLRALVPVMGTVLLGACGGGGEEDSDATPTPGTLQISTAAQSVGEAAGTVTIAVTRTGGSDGAVSATLTTTAGTATSSDDFTSASVTVAFAAGDSATKTVIVVITNDAIEEPDEAFTATLSAATGGATLGALVATVVTIQDDDAPGPATAGNKLNDTGVTLCTNGVNTGVACNNATVGTDQYPDQDAQFGRDFTANDDSDGRVGFSFTKLDSAGAPLANQTLAFSVAPWACVKDNVTALTWEVKSDDDGFRDKDWTYSWFNSTGIGDGGDQGKDNGGICIGGSACDTEKYVAAVNALALCGHADWRLPQRSELLSLIDYGSSAAPFVDINRFPELVNIAYWSNTSILSEAHAVSVTDGEVRSLNKQLRQAIRLVRGGRTL